MLLIVKPLHSRRYMYLIVCFLLDPADQHRQVCDGQLSVRIHICSFLPILVQNLQRD